MLGNFSTVVDTFQLQLELNSDIRVTSELTCVSAYAVGGESLDYLGYRGYMENPK